MTAYVFDANAIVALIEDQPGAEQVNRILSHDQDDSEFLISAVNWGEVFYIAARRLSREKLRSVLGEVRRTIDVTSIDIETAERAAEIKHFYKLGYADAFAAALAIDERATLVTADPDFKKLGSKLKLKMLPGRKRRQ